MGSLREEKDFFDVTLACEDEEQVSAHKVILSACSPFFRNILKKNPHQHPLLYLKGVKYRELQNILTFIYLGEVSVSQDELNTFLSIAEELHVKGLTQGAGESAKSQNQTRNIPVKRSGAGQIPWGEPSKRAKHMLEEDEIEEVMRVKSEPKETMLMPQHHTDTTPEILEDLQDYDYEGYDDGTNITESTNAFDTTMDKECLDSQIEQHMTKTGADWHCLTCGWQTSNRSRLWEHVEATHVHTTGYSCQICDKFCATKNALK